jgi:hypothetical protein
MINADMREYEYYTYGDRDGYGHPALSQDVQGTIKMAIYTTAQAIQDNIAYKSATYVGLTHNSKVNDTYVIKFENKRLKVLYVQTLGRYKQVFMGDM